MLKLAALSDLQALITNQVREGSALEYKRSLAAKNTDKCKAEISKDVSAMANANGGQIVYGMVEENDLPVELDGGLDPANFDRLWFEQVIQQNVRPQIEGLDIHAIECAKRNNIYIILSVPAAVVRAPHQAKDGRYY